MGTLRLKIKNTPHALQALASLALLLLVWWAATAAGLVNPLYLPGPGEVWNAFVEANICRPMSTDSDRIICGEQQYFLWQHLLVSLQRIGIGMALAIVAGMLIGFVLAEVEWISRIFLPYINFVRALPPLGYIGLLIVWFGIGDTTKIWLLFLAAFPPIVLATLDGINGVSRDRVNSARALGAGTFQTFIFVVFPSALPSIMNGIRLAVGFAWTTVVAAELNNGIPGIGALAYLSGTELNTPLTIACIFVIGIAALLLDGLIQLITRLVTPWVGQD
ncbi:ABC transporter permease [Bifidobacterium eulemuris]|uniref:ABC transporter permease n=1 Tax=Bifidobacterium eulemuris TaxID=1765219 RepID=A0A261GDZ0_9BIFI|nr:ABC transporter permease [Bifidobacterium eulemuris]OZG69661.1 taurine ABC transporter permease [Bifidobacterium eulemuris]QOL32230.1 ABC transporter permease [Bifidobacterium eulemuris]